MRVKFLLAAVSLASFGANRVAAQSADQSHAVLKAVGAYVATTYGRRISVLRIPVCTRDRLCPDAALADAYQRDVAAGGGLFGSTIDELPSTCDARVRCRFSSVDGAVRVGAPVVTGNLATVRLMASRNGPHSGPMSTVFGTLTLTHEDGIWAPTQWVIDTYF